MLIPTWAAITGGVAGAAGVVGVLSNFGKIVSFVGSAASWLRERLTDRDLAPGLPKQTIVAIQHPRFNALWWHLGQMGERPMLQVVGDFNVTNTWNQPVRLAGALLRYRRWGIFARIERGDTSVKAVGSQYSGDYPIPPNHMTWLRVSFHIVLKHHEPRKRFNVDLAIIDQFGNHHWIKGLIFRHTDAMFD
ncbi:hypothetical protein [Paraburkholderia tagetis]|uniref:Uncharacterized protein n=1 Tax=Paraburkholderia tagetis TaxID=2913261 RepID=A0A9X1UNX9_9BURK|nr:hypothetical protein [Paraburkholderia tagetis]MCG5078909.1 hypothetical protein [Paraburkholderia tagetis]